MAAVSAENHKILKFVPAGGAASRMFKNLFQYLEDGVETEFIQEFLTHIDDFAFGSELAGLTGQEAVHHLLYDMHYGDLPKGLLLFHKYRDGARTPAPEHLVEGALYAVSNGTAALHFTVSHRHLPLFRQHIAEYLQKYQEKYGVRYDISFRSRCHLPTHLLPMPTVHLSATRMANCCSVRADMGL